MELGPVGRLIKSKLEKALAPERLVVIDESHLHAGHAGAHVDGESHFRVKIAARSFTGKSRVAQHRLVNEALAEELRNRVHALAIESAVPE